MSGGSGGGANPWLVAIVVTMGAFMEILDTTIVNVALPHIAGGLAVSTDQSTWSLTTYLVANGIVLTISNDLSVRIGRKRYFLACIAGFTACSFVCGVSTSFVELLAFRALQGLFGGGLQPTQQAIILDTFPPEQRGAAFSITAVATILAPVIGPVVGGWLTDQYSWHWIFLINLPIGILTFFGAASLVQDSPDAEKQARERPPLDITGILFIAVALGCLEVAVDRGEDLDWLGSGLIRTLFALSALGFAFGITHLLRARHPVVNLRVFADKNFAIGWMLIGLMGFVLYASAVTIPQFAQQQLGYTATLAGLVLAPGAVVLAVLIPLMARLLNVIPVKYIIMTGGLALGGALLLSQDLVADLDFKHLALLRATQTSALSFLFVPISAAAYATLAKPLQGDGAALFTMARNVMGGLGISISTALTTERSQIRQSYLVEHLSPTNQAYAVLLQQVERGLSGLGTAADQARRMAPGRVFQELGSQVAALAYADVFLVTGCLALVITPLALFLVGGKQQAQGGGE